MSRTFVRQFDLRVDGAKKLDDVKAWLLDLVAKETKSGEIQTSQVKPVERLNLLKVRLEGSAAGVSRVVANIADGSGLRIQHDSVRVRPPAAPKPDYLVPPPALDYPALVPPPVLDYPDLPALLRIGLEPGLLVPPIRPKPTSMTASETVTVAVVDSGIMVTHPDLEHRLWSGTIGGLPHKHGVRCIGGELSSDIADQDGHGTMLAGTVLSVTGGAPDVRLMAVMFFDARALPGPANAAAAIGFAAKAQPKADIINLSWDISIGSFALEEAIDKACEGGALVVIAAGNSGSDNDRSLAIPAHYRKICPERIITVMATDRYDEKASFSNYGAETVDLAAPGVGVMTTRASLSTTSKNGLKQNPFYRRHVSYNGTSVAAALVSGAAALLKSRNRSLTADALKECLIRTVDPVPGLKCKSGGRLNVANALARCCD